MKQWLPAIFLLISTSSSAPVGKELAASYDSPKCRALIEVTAERMNFTSFCSTWVQQEVYGLKLNGISSYWVRNNKAGSEMLQRGVPIMIQPPLGAWTSKNFFKYGDDREKVDPSVYVWAMVRQPWERTVSGYQQIIYQIYGHRPREPKTNVTDAIKAHLDPTEAFLAFLEAVRDGMSVGRDGFHVFPQAMLIDTIAPRGGEKKRFDSITKLESASEDLPEILTTLGATDFDIATPLSNHHHSWEGLANRKINETDPRIARIFCKLYEVDFVCFNYKPPPQCAPILGF